MRNKPRVLVVAHDGGGAEIVSSFIVDNRKKYTFIVRIAGPACAIFERKKIRFEMITNKKPDDLLTHLAPISLVLTGTGGAPHYELAYIRAAKARGIKTVAFLDHWIHYQRRFGYPESGWKKNIPDELWVGDKAALKLARATFPTTTVKMVENPYFKDVERAYRIANHRRTKRTGKTILFISEPINRNVKRKKRDITLSKRFESALTEFNILEKLLRYCAPISNYTKLIIRLHPAEKKSKYDVLLKRYSEQVEVRKSSSSLADDLSRVTTVIGMESTALYLANKLGKKVVCIRPARKSMFTLPIKCIKIDSLEKLNKYL